ncbi:MAG TPA: GlsB/YeaQ/YmgE family stress response membrane protein [Chloroflexota bacterium]
MKGGGYGLVGDIIVGIIGAFVGGLLFGLVLPGSSVGFIGSIVVAFIGAVVLIAILRMVSGRSRSSGRI